jgi:mannose/fructose/N-acetylgalactosamine-specific phosphotransferase system component IID
MEILSVQKSDSVNNSRKLTARWEYNITPAVKKKKNKKNNRKDSLKEIIEDIS